MRNRKQKSSQEIELRFDKGTLVVEGLNSITDSLAIFPYLSWDERIASYRCHAYKYRYIIRTLYKNNIGFTDFVPNYNKLEIKMEADQTPYLHQQEALETWQRSKLGTVVLPTGSGKTFFAAMAIQQVQRSTLVIVPTIDLILQWHQFLSQIFSTPIGMLGGGSSDIQDITVSTYESARIRADTLGRKFCFLIFDECHHLPSRANAEMARSYIAPYRLGLTATPAEEDEKVKLLSDLAGPVLYAKNITHLSGPILAPYSVETVPVELTRAEMEKYQYEREEYLAFRREMESRRGRKFFSWENFVFFASQSREGRKALRSFHRQKQIAISASNKFDALVTILQRHHQERVLIFTNDNHTAYLISSYFLLPLITHETKAAERKEILDNFKSGLWPFLVSSKVLNEGVDVPEAGVAVIFSGNSTVREHVQRLGRILRKQGGKQAILYELITKDTGEVFTSRRRRKHDAYAKSKRKPF